MPGVASALLLQAHESPGGRVELKAVSEPVVAITLPVGRAGQLMSGQFMLTLSCLDGVSTTSDGRHGTRLCGCLTSL